MTTKLLEIDKLHKRFDGIKALDNFSCSIQQREIVGIIGPNGAGKTTLFNVITSFTSPDHGQVLFHGNNLLRISPHRVARIGIARTFQNLRLIYDLNVLDNVLLSFRNQPGEHLFNSLFRWKASKKVEEKNIEIALSLLRDAGLIEKYKDAAMALSYGQQKLLSIVCCLAMDADLLLLDEPVAGIAPEMKEKILLIISELANKEKSIMLIEHDFDAIMRICNRVIFMDVGKNICEGTPEQVRNDPRVIEAYIN